jgi:hypothetical protein
MVAGRRLGRYDAGKEWANQFPAERPDHSLSQDSQVAIPAEAEGVIWKADGWR